MLIVSHFRQDELNELLARLDELHAQSEDDVELAKATLKEANEIYKTLKGVWFFQLPKLVNVLLKVWVLLTLRYYITLRPVLWK